MYFKTFILFSSLSCFVYSSQDAALPSSFLPPQLTQGNAEDSADDVVPASQHRQIYGIATYDSLFKYVLSQKSVQASFFRTFLPGIPVKSIERLDDHMNPIKSFQHLRDTLAGEGVDKVVRTLKRSHEFSVHTKGKEKGSSLVHDDATKFLKDVVTHFDDFQALIPKPEYNGTMDFVCELDNGDYALVEMQVVPQSHWDERALAYVAAFMETNCAKGIHGKTLKKLSASIF